MEWPTLDVLVEELKAGKRDVVELTRTCLDEIEKAKEFHALIEINHAALDRARAVAKAPKKGKLYGVPYIAKDNFLTYGTKTTAASNILANFSAPFQATAIQKLEAEGAILIGKSNLDSFAHGSSTENSDFGPTKNPHDDTRVPGGTSGGSAAAVSLGLCAFALGTDTGGSIRQPASFTGTVGMRPTYGLVSRYGVVANVSSMDTINSLTRSVADSAYVLDILAGPDGKDSTMIERQSDYKSLKITKKVKIGIIKNHLSQGVQTEVVAAVKEIAKKLAESGSSLNEVSIEFEEFSLPAYYIIIPAEISSNLARYDGIRFGASDQSAGDLENLYLQTRGRGFNKETMRRIFIGTYVLSAGYYDAYYKQAMKVRSLIKNSYEKALAKYDVLIGPVAPSTAFKLGENTDDPLKMYLEDAMTVGIPLAGVPAVSVPVAKDKNNLPIGLQIIGSQRDDKCVLEVAQLVESLAGYES